MKWTGDRIRTLRLRLGWSQAELARRLGCRQQTVSEWETNIYQPQNAYSRLLDMMMNDVDAYSAKMSNQVASEVFMRENNLSQVADNVLLTGLPFRDSKEGR